MRKTKIGVKTDHGNKIVQPDRLCDVIDISLRDLIVKDLLTDTEIKMYYEKDKAEMLPLFTIYIDKHEKDPSVVFNLSVNGEPASIICKSYEIVTLAGNNNDTGNEPLFGIGSILQDAPDSIVEFPIPIDSNLNSFSEHKNGKSYANYVIYGIEKKGKSKIMLCKGKIYMTDVIYDLTENILDGQ